MYSNAFLEYQKNIPTAPPPMGRPDGPGSAYIPEEFAHLDVPMMPPDYVPPEPEIPMGFTGGKIELGGVTGLHLTRDDAREKAALLYIHGGGYTIGSAMTAGPLLAHFLEHTGLEGYAVEYRLAPYHKFPAQYNDCVAFYRGLLDLGYERIVVGGESAGACMTLGLIQALKMETLPLPAAIWCSSPVDNIRFDQEELFLQDMFCQSNDNMLEAYVGSADPKDPRLSPIYGDFTAGPPAFIQAGGLESPAAGALRMAYKLARDGCEVHTTFGKGMPHTFAMDYALYPEARNAMNEILTFINNVLDLE